MSEQASQRGQLAIALQEVLTATGRVRTNQQIPNDAQTFRAQIRHLLAGAEQQARQAGYTREAINLALYAVVAFLDETVLSSPRSVFADWPRQPLQDEIFGDHLGGEVFFQHVRRLLAQPESEELADVLEVFELCMLLGFHGRYSVGDTGELQVLLTRAGEKINRIRGGLEPLSPAWAPPPIEASAAVSDRWLRRLGYAAGGLLALAILSFIAFHYDLRSAISELQVIASRPFA